MEYDVRFPKLIQEELSDLQELIRIEQEAIAKHPDHKELIILHGTTLEREQYLFQELEESLKRFGLEPFDISFSGDTVRKNGILLEFLGKVVSSFQGTLTLISQQIQNTSLRRAKNHFKYIQESRSLYLIGTGPGSFRIILSSQQPYIGGSLAYLALDTFNQLMDCRDDEKSLKEQITKLDFKIIMRYKQFLEVIYKTGSDVKFYDKMIPSGFQTKEITSDLAKSIHEILDKSETSPDEVVSLRGSLKGISLLSHKFEFLVDEPQKEIKGPFNPKLESDVKDRFDRMVRAKFKVSKEWIEIKDTFKEKYELIGFED